MYVLVRSKNLSHSFWLNQDFFDVASQIIFTSVCKKCPSCWILILTAWCTFPLNYITAAMIFWISLRHFLIDEFHYPLPSTRHSHPIRKILMSIFWKGFQFSVFSSLSDWEFRNLYFHIFHKSNSEPYLCFTNIFLVKRVSTMMVVRKNAAWGPNSRWEFF